MAVKFELDPKKDQVVPCKALKDFNNKFLVEAIRGDDAFKRLFAGEEKGKKEAIKQLSDSINSLPDTGRVWFVKRFLVGFGNKVNDAAEEAFEELEKNNAFNELKAATEAYNGKLKDATLATANEAKSLQSTLINKFSPAVADFSKNYIASKGGGGGTATGTTPSGGAPVTATGGAGVTAAESIDRELYQSKKLLELGFITQNEYLAKLVEIKNIILEADAPPAVNPEIYQRAFTQAVSTNRNQPITRLQWKQALLQLLTPKRDDILKGVAAKIVSEETSTSTTTGVTEPTAAIFGFGQSAKPLADQLNNPNMATALADQIVRALRDPDRTAQAIQALQASISGIPNDANEIIAILQPPSLEEAIYKELRISKKYLRLGFITESEYLATLVRTKNLLQEQAPAPSPAPVAPTAAPTAAPEETQLDQKLNALGITSENLTKAWTDIANVNANKALIVSADLPTPATTPATPGAGKDDAVMQAIATLSGKEGAKDGEINKLVDASVGLQNTLTKFNETIVTEGFSLRQKQLAKLYVKKQVLSEYNKTGNFPTKTQLNEFFIASLLLAALAGVFAWAASKLGEIFKGAYAPSGTPQGYKSKDGPDLNKTITSIVSSLGAGYGADNKIVDINNNPVKGLKEELGALTTDLTAKREAINNCIDVIANTGGEAARFATYKDAIDTTRLTNSLNSLLNL